MSFKITNRPLSDESKGTKSSSEKGKFDKMLDDHLSQVRAGKGEIFNEGRELDPEMKELFDLSQLQTLDNGYFEKACQLTPNTSFWQKNAPLAERVYKYQPLITSIAEENGLDPILFASLIRQESNFNPHAVSRCGAMGLGQLMPSTARAMGVKDPFNAVENQQGSAKYLRQQLDKFDGNVKLALAAYNAGPAAVSKYRGVPPFNETKTYVKSIENHYHNIRDLDVFDVQDPTQWAVADRHKPSLG
jgi:hypothetical protein